MPAAKRRPRQIQTRSAYQRVAEFSPHLAQRKRACPPIQFQALLSHPPTWQFQRPTIFQKFNSVIIARAHIRAKPCPCFPNDLKLYKSAERPTKLGKLITKVFWGLKSHTRGFIRGENAAFLDHRLRNCKKGYVTFRKQESLELLDVPAI